MSRCIRCNKVLNDYELTLKTPEGKYLDTCLGCLPSDVDVVDRPDLLYTATVEYVYDDVEETTFPYESYKDEDDYAS